MERRIDIEEEREELNEWVLRSIELFENTNYLDRITSVYPFHTIKATSLDYNLKRRIVMAHQSRNSIELIQIFRNELTRFAYDEPLWYLYKNINDVEENNPNQLKRIIQSLYSLTADEIIDKLEVAPKLNTQIGPMFTNWLRENFNLLSIDDFTNSTEGIHILNSSEQDGKTFVNEILNQDLEKRPDLVAKVNNTYIIGEAKWVGQSGGNQEKQVKEVLKFCSNQLRNVIRIGIVDGFPWAIKNNRGNIVSRKENVKIQESEYDIISALLLNDYLSSFL